jgi:hypothetical protein
LAALFVFAASPKLTGAQMFGHIGAGQRQRYLTGTAELA